MTIKKITSAQLSSPLSTNTTGTASNVTGTVAIDNGGTGAGSAATARSNLGAAASGANTDITSITGSAATLTGDHTNWASYRSSTVANMLGWKNYNNGHVIFDASQGTSPTGSGINNSNAEVAWGATYPTLMGWNGANSYGVRVDSARVADNISSYTINQNLGTGNSPTFAGITATGNIGAANFSGTSSGTNTGDQVNISGNAVTATNAANSALLNGKTEANLNVATAGTAGNITAHTINQSLGTGNSPTFANVYTGNGGSVGIGDDVIFTDVGIGNNCRLQGQQNADRAGLIFGNSDTSSLYRIGTGPLTYQSNFEVQGYFTQNTANKPSIFTLQTITSTNDIGIPTLGTNPEIYLNKQQINVNGYKTLNGGDLSNQFYGFGLTSNVTGAGIGGVSYYLQKVFMNVLTSPFKTNGEFAAIVGAVNGGAAADKPGALFAGNFFASTAVGCTGWHNVTGSEFNTDCQSYVAYKTGIQIVSQNHDTTMGGLEAAIAIGATVPDSGENGYFTGILFCDQHGSKPIRSGGRLIYAKGTRTVAIGLDFSEYAFTTASINCPGFNVGPDGSLATGAYMTASTLAGSGTRALYSNYAGTLTNTASDSRLKTNIINYTGGLSSVMQLNPIYYNWLDIISRGPQTEIGFIAQEVQEVIPEVIGTNADGMLSLDYAKMVAVLTKAIQEQQEMIAELNNRITTLEQP